MKIKAVFFKYCPPFRLIIWLMIFSGTLLDHIVFTNMSIIILAMVEPARSHQSQIVIPECKIVLSVNLTGSAQIESFTKHYGERFEWSPQLQRLMIEAIFYGFIPFSLISGYLCERFGPKVCILTSFITGVVLLFLHPWAAKYPMLLFAMRISIGSMAGTLYPSCQYLIAKYAPPNEKGSFVGALSGSNFGAAISWPLTNFIIEHCGWPWVFYLSGIVISVWLVLFYFLVYDDVREHPLMPENEKCYIIQNQTADTLGVVKNAAPYKQMLCSVPFWALMILHFGYFWGVSFLRTALPNYMGTVLGYSLGYKGILTSLPFLFFSGATFGRISDIVSGKGWMAPTSQIKFFTLFSHIIPGLLLLCLVFAGCNVTIVILLQTISMGLSGSATTTCFKNPQDLAPNFSPSIYSIINSVGYSTGIIVPLIIDNLTYDKNDIAEWTKVFYLGSSIYVSCAVIFWIFGTANVQSWNNKNNRTTINKMNKTYNDEVITVCNDNLK